MAAADATYVEDGRTDAAALLVENRRSSAISGHVDLQSRNAVSELEASYGAGGLTDNTSLSGLVRGASSNNLTQAVGGATGKPPTSSFSRNLQRMKEDYH